MDNTKRGTQGFGSSNNKDQSVKPRIQINEISARAFGQFYRREEEVGILKWDEVEDEIQLEAINISTELAIKNKKNNEHLSTKEIVPREYHHMLDVFEKGEKITVPPHRLGVDLGIELEKGKEVPIKKIYSLSYDQIKELHGYIKQNEARGWIQRVWTGRASPIMFVKKRTANSDSVLIIEHSMKSPRRIGIHYLSLAKHLTDWQEPNTLPSWISRTPITTFESRKGRNTKQRFRPS